MKTADVEKIKRIETKLLRLEEELDMAEYGSYEYDVVAGDIEYLTLVLKKLKKSRV